MVSNKVNQPSCDLVLSSYVTDASCELVADGAIDLVVSGSGAPFTYDWSNDGADVPDNDPQDLSGLPAGSYTVTVTDNFGCEAVLMVLVEQPTAIQIAGNVGDVTTVGGNDGYVDLTVSGGTPNYTFDWDNDGAETPDDDTEDLFDLVAGTYVVTVTDANLCTGTESFTVADPLIFDLALRKTLATGQSYSVLPGDLVTFTVTVFNQGQLTATNMLVIDYLPANMTFNAAQNPGWVNFGAGPTLFISSLAPGASYSKNLKLQVSLSAPNGILNNYAEISAADDADPNTADPPTDVDSEPNAFQLDDPGGLPGSPADNIITGDGSGAPGSNNPLTDEDDHDGAAVLVNTPMLGLGNLVFLDYENDGVFNNLDEGVQGVEVELYSVGLDLIQGTFDDQLVDVQYTDDNGEYSFSILSEGSYYVMLTGNGFPADHVSSTGDGIYDMDGAGAYEPATGTDLDVDGTDDGTQMGTTVMSEAIELAFGTEPDGDDNLTVDFGLYEPVPVPTLRLGNLVFLDYDNDGVFNNSDIGIEGVEVELYDAGPDQTQGTPDDQLIANQSTNFFGEYLFTGVLEGFYFVKLNGNGIPVNYISSTGDGAFDMDGAGAYEPATGTDLDEDGTDDGTQIGAMVTSEVIELALGTEPDGDDNFTVDFGLYEPQQTALSLGNLVFYDNDNDGVFNNSDAGIQYVEVELYDAGPDHLRGTPDDQLVDNQSTNYFGGYLFTGLAEGFYFVKLNGNGIPANHVSSTGDGIYDMDGAGAYEPASGTDLDVDGTDDGTQIGAMVMSEVIELAYGTEPDGYANYTVDFGLYEPQQQTLSLGNLVFLDYENDGVFNNFDAGIQHVEVELYDAGPDQTQGTPDDQLIGNQSTNFFGEYLFTGLAEGFYFVTLNGNGIPATLVSSTGDGVYDNDGSGAYEPATGTDLDVDNTDDGTQMGAMVMSEVIELAFDTEPDGDVNYTVDFGLYEPQIQPTLSLGNLVFYDYDNDGVFNNFDAGLQNVEVELYDAGSDQTQGTPDDQLIDNQSTNISGEYLFTGLAEGFYFVKLNGNGIPANHVSSTGDGVYDMDSAGAYEPSTGTDLDEDGTDDGTQMGAMVVSAVIELAFGTEPFGDVNLTVDFGLYEPQIQPTLSLGNLVFLDAENDGIFNNADAGIEDVEVELYDAGPDQTQGTPDDQLLANQTTNGFGEYLFTGLSEGFYFVKLSGNGIPANHVSSTGDGVYDMDGAGAYEPATGTNFNVDGADDGTQMGAMIMSEVIELTLGDEPDGDVNLTVDFGLYAPVQPASLGNFAWYDNNHNGQQDPGEPGVENLIVDLMSTGPDGVKGGGDDFLFASQTTPANGIYYFQNIPQGNYYLKFDGSSFPANFNPTVQNQGDDLTDSDVDLMGMTDVITLEPGEVNVTVDFGIEPEPASFGNFVWQDYDGDGVQDASEPGVAGIHVYLLDLGNDGLKGNDDNQIATDITDANGEYGFTNLNPGSYYIVFDPTSLPQGFASTAQDAGGNDDEDSDANQMGMTEILVLAAGQTYNSVDLGIYSSNFDLSLTKTLSPGQSTLVDIGDQIAYTITVTNEGDNPVYAVNLVDHIPAGLILSAGNTGWNQLDLHTAEYIITGPILPGESESVEILMTVQYAASGATLFNQAEVASVEDINGDVVTDVDSTPDNAAPNEDDMDEVQIELVPHDPTGWIYCDKTGKIITGGTISVTGPNGIPDDQVFIINDGSNGYYEFYTNGTPGVYTINYTHPDGYPLSLTCIEQAGPFDPTGLPDPIVFGVDTLNAMYLSDTTCGSNPYYLSFDIEPGDPNIHLNNLPVSCVFISSIVSDDTNLNDAFDGGDTPQVGVTVYLYDCADLTTPIATTITDATGRYSFDGLLPGDYVVGLPTTANARFISTGNINQSGFSDCMSLAWGECDTTKAFCIYPCPTINAGPDIDHCSSANSSQLDANLSHGIGNFSWTPPTGLNDATIENPVASPAATTSYEVSFNDGFGCVDFDTIVVNVGTSTPYLTNMPFTDTFVQCAPLPSETPIFADDCDADLTIVADTTTTPLPCGFVQEITWIATNDEGNSTSFSQTLTVNDTLAPTMAASHAFFGAILDGDTLYADCTQIPSLDSLGFSAFDNCSVPTVTFSETITNGSCPIDGFYQLRNCGWTATDACGNVDSLFFTVIIYDTLAPTMFASHAFFGAILHGDTLYADCSMIPSLDSIGFSAFDNCSVPTVTFSENITNGSCTMDGFYQLRNCGWTATDSCGNVDSLFFTVVIYDNLAPVLSPVPGDVTVSCTAIPAPANITVSDNCDASPTLTLTEVPTADANGCISQILRIWTAEDECGNTNVASQTITVFDNTAPTLVGVPADANLDCNAAIPAAPLVTATDSCDADVPVIFDENTAGNPADECYTITRTWTATDDCGNTATASQTITISDSTPPTFINVPADTSIDCSAQIPAAAPVTASDFCDSDVSVTFDQSTMGNSATGCYSIIRTWTATDNCGNTAIASQTITIYDSTAPAFSGVPADTTINCEIAIPAPAAVVAFDLCDADVPTIFNQNISGNPATGCYVITRTWTATDDCGNTATASHTITVQDTISPSLSAQPADLSLDCVSAIPTAPTITATDNCDSNVPVFYFENSNGNPLGCNLQITRIWAAADDCGNVVVWTQTITVNDTVPPVLGAVPANLMMNCSLPIPAAPIVTATDNCDASVAVTMDSTYLGDPASGCYILTRTWTATDDCGNTDTTSQQIQVIDTEAPNFVGLPANGAANCDSIPGENVTATDNCDATVDITISDLIQSSVFGCVTQVVRTWTAADDCGNIRIASRTFNLSNTDVPVISIVEPAMVGVQDGDVLYLECDDLVALSAASATATADCCGAPNITFHETVAGSNCQANGYMAMMHCGWIATDCCGNSDSLFFTVYVIDNTPPLFYGVPDSLILPVGSPLPAPPIVFAVDNCDNSVPVSYNSTTSGPADNQLTTRTWSSTDDCGNIAIAVQTILITNDITAPLLANVPPDVTIEGPVSNLPDNNGVTATDDLDAHPEISFVEERTGGICCYVVTRTWTATDDFGNSSQATQTITVTDTQSPVIAGAVADVTGTCSSSDVPMPQLSATDNCTDVLTLTFTADTTQLACGYHVLRTWAFTDECGNTAIATQNITLEDTEAPVFDPTSGSALAFFASQNASANGGVSLAIGDKLTANQTWSIGNQTMPNFAGVATDNCTAPDQIGFRVLNIVEVNSGCEHSFVVSFEVLDACGNVAPALFTATASFVDDKAPSFASLPQDLSVNCGNVPAPAILSASDDSGIVSVDFGETELPGCPIIITRTWTATDGCGNLTIAKQKITVTDNAAPVIANVPANKMASCENVPPVPTNVLATDNCSGATPVVFSETIAGGNCQYTITRTWTATDACGNSDIKQQYIWVADNTAPTIATNPSTNLTVSCDAALPPVPNNVVSDNCDDSPSVDLVETILPGNSCSFSVHRTWTVTDACGNSAIAEQIIHVTDNTLPTLANIPADITVNCGSIPAAPAMLAGDNCDTDVEVIFKETVVPSPTGCPYNIVRNWIAVDNCGKQAEATQTITVVDNEPPVLSAAPANLSVSCNADVPAAAQLTATDNCDLSAVVTMNETVVGTGCNKTILRTWTATDACGNTTTASQTIEVSDTEPPVLSASPANLSVTCGADVPAAAQLTATDNCGLTAVTMNETVLGSGACDKTILRTWTATDACGNTATASQTIEVSDAEPPVIAGAPANLALNCGDQIPASVALTATDNCTANVQVVFVETASATTCGQEILRTWTATDDCGNNSSVSQLISLTDQQAPTAAEPVDLTVNCGEQLPAATPVFSDDCDQQLTIQYSEIATQVACGKNVLRTWTATDDCGNSTVVDQIIHVTDLAAPVLTFANPALMGFSDGDTMILSCANGLIFNKLDVEATDNCSNVTVQMDMAGFNYGNCLVDGYLVAAKFNWVATDDCGNSSSLTLNVRVQDNEPPIFPSLPDVVVNCGEAAPIHHA
ncbi:MAG: DUF11 domain-containing protein [Saprospiraceae bacterium]|nr:DUF11 domain-containing protein [Saprospiraceae bacterium]